MMIGRGVGNPVAGVSLVSVVAVGCGVFVAGSEGVSGATGRVGITVEPGVGVLPGPGDGTMLRSDVGVAVASTEGAETSPDVQASAAADTASATKLSLIRAVFKNSVAPPNSISRCLPPLSIYSLTPTVQPVCGVVRVLCAERPGDQHRHSNYRNIRNKRPERPRLQHPHQPRYRKISRHKRDRRAEQDQPPRPVR